MAKQIKWSLKAKNERSEILKYWYERNGNKNYCRKLSQEFRETIRYISEHNYLGISTDEENVRVAVCGYYMLFYEIKKEVVEILAIWDNRRNPQDLRKK